MPFFFYLVVVYFPNYGGILNVVVISENIFADIQNYRFISVFIIQNKLFQVKRFGIKCSIINI